MGLFSGRKPHSGLVAKERLSNLLMAERLNCSPASLQMPVSYTHLDVYKRQPIYSMKIPGRVVGGIHEKKWITKPADDGTAI